MGIVLVWVSSMATAVTTLGWGAGLSLSKERTSGSARALEFDAKHAE